MKVAAGQYFAYLDADDIWLPGKLEKQIQAFQKHPEIGVCAANAQNFNAGGLIPNSTEPDKFLGKASIPLVTCSLSIPLSTLIIRRAVFDKIGGFDEGIISFVEDYDFLLRASGEFDFCKLEDIAVHYRTGHTNASSKFGDQRRDFVMNDIIPRFRKLYPGKIKWYHVWQLHASCYYGRAISRKNWFTKTYWLLRSFACCPFNWDTNINIVYQFVPKQIIHIRKKLCQK
jgi:GT2 family glycosyltransferase